MALTLPQEHAWLAAATGATAIFLWDEDALAGPNGVAAHLSTFLNQVTPGVHETNTAAARYAAATSGPESHAFARHWNTFTANTGTSPEPGRDSEAGTGTDIDSAPGDAGGTTDPLQIAAGAAVLLSLAAAGIVLFKTGILARLAWCAQQLAFSGAAGPSGALTAAQAIATTRVANTATTHQLLQHLADKIAPRLRHYSAALLRGRHPAPDSLGGYGNAPTRFGRPGAMKDPRTTLPAAMTAPLAKKGTGPTRGMRPDIQEAVLEMENAGWRIEQRNGHAKAVAFCPAGECKQSIYGTPGQGHAKHLKRVLKACKDQGHVK
ncbi:hypothetical protein [Nonomuraea recticatena]|uniref:Uncharacterized protein n=1 Tax=Nonomuraea recticatena TaxID=46178 RepID=A0ABN3TCT7_9ACTN